MNVDDLIAKWLGTAGGAERANYVMFLSDLCRALDLPEPSPATGGALADYQFEAPVKSAAALPGKGTGRIDLYRRNSFVLEAKQSQLKPGETAPPEPSAPPPEPVRDLLGYVIGHATAAKAAPRYDRLMADARIQAERYALALPADHKTPPFLIVADIGRTFELYFDWAGNGRGYSFFPDQQSYRIALDDLREPKVVALLRGIWLEPASVDPRLKAVAVTRDIASRLARVAAKLEDDQRKRHGDPTATALGIESTSLFLMRLLFCMFAEDVGLLEPDSFKTFLERAAGARPEYWRGGLETLWQTMNRPGDNRYWMAGDALVRYFNGNLFAATQIYDLPDEYKNELRVAADKDWRAVEPAIFGTLLEQVLTPADRAKLGAHYTPRAYVERLVEATIMDVLRPEWDAAAAAARAAVEGGDTRAGVAAVMAFHARLSAVAVLDPACGTGNFLYVAMESLLRLEGEIIELARTLGTVIAPAVVPGQFLGLEKNPRAAVIAELVLWIGWLRYRLANTPDAIRDPVLPTLTNINFGTHGGYDAVLATTATGEPDTADPRQPPWPAADFIVGNPPFIGGKDRLGGDYVQALWRANPDVPKSADFVMQWWHRAAHILTTPGTRLHRFGFVTTNSITQSFSRRVIANHLAGDRLSLVVAVPDHPWTRVGKDAAAVRIAMTVAAAGTHDGTMLTVTHEAGLDTDDPVIECRAERGTINADLSIGTDVTAVRPLRANAGICHDGVKLHGAGFIVTAALARELGLGSRPGLDSHIRPYRNGRDLAAISRGLLAIDLFGLSEKDVRDGFPEVYSHLLATVWDSTDKKTGKPNGRSVNARSSYKKYWWVFGEPRRDLRPALVGLNRFIVTVDTSAHRVFQFISPEVICDDKSVIIALETSFDLGVLSSRLHVEWSIRLGGWLGFGNDSVYVKTVVFDPFPFPDATPAQRATIAAIAGDLDVTRRAALDEVPSLTMTGLYNLVAAVRRGETGDEAVVRRARARIVAKLHDDLDAAVAAAYGWADDHAAGRLTPTAIVARLVALNAERRAEEAAGFVRWLRPDYQAPGAAVTAPD